MMVGGSTSGLVSLLRALDSSKIDADLILYKSRGELIDDIPSYVNVLNQASKYPEETPIAFIKKTCVLFFKGYLFKALYNEWKYNKRIGLNNQVMAYAQASISKKIEKQYDVAISFLELWANAYLTCCTNAKRKIGWIHVDYEKARYIGKLDKNNFKKIDKMICVSQSCLNSFIKTFPELEKKSGFIENVVSPEHIREKAEKEKGIDDEGFKIITVCRLTINTKGLDRAVKAAARLKDEGYDFKWYIVGDGEDKEELESLIYNNDLSDMMHLLGLKLNPYPYLKSCNLFVLPSRTEGKPIAVTEAQILGLPVIITNYVSASEQVMDGVDGLIIDNSLEDAVYHAIKNVMDNPDLLKRFKDNVDGKKFDNQAILEEFYDLIP